MSVSALKRQALSALKGSWGVAIINYLLFVSIASLLLQTRIGFILIGMFALGYVAVSTSIARGYPTSVKTAFEGFRKASVSAFVAGILIPLFSCLWGLLLIIPGIVKFYSYSMTFHILNDSPDLSAKEAIMESRKIMHGHKMDLFLLDLSFIGWILLSIITFGILSVYTVPYMQEAHAAFYESIKCTETEEEIMTAEFVEDPSAEV